MSSEGLKGWKLKKRCRVAESQQLNGGPSRTQLAKLCMPCAPTRGPDGMEAPSSRSSPNLVHSVPSLVHPPFHPATQCDLVLPNAKSTPPCLLLHYLNAPFAHFFFSLQVGCRKTWIVIKLIKFPVRKKYKKMVYHKDHVTLSPPFCNNNQIAPKQSLYMIGWLVCSRQLVCCCLPFVPSAAIQMNTIISDFKIMPSTNAAALHVMTRQHYITLPSRWWFFPSSNVSSFILTNRLSLKIVT